MNPVLPGAVKPVFVRVFSFFCFLSFLFVLLSALARARTFVYEPEFLQKQKDEKERILVAGSFCFVVCFVVVLLWLG